MLLDHEGLKDAESVRRAIASGERLLEQGSRTITAAGDVVIKTGNRQAIEREARNIQFIAQQTDLPVPKVYACMDLDDRKTALVMERIHGTTLQVAFHSLSEEEHTAIASQMARYIDDLRQHTLLNHFGCIDGGGFNDVLFDPPPGLAFASGREFQDYWKLRFACSARPFDVSAVESILDRYADDNVGVLTHGDLATRNIMVNEGKIVGILDWELAGYYPSCWEAIRMKWDVQAPLSWQKLLPDIMSMYHDQSIAYSWMLEVVCT